MTSRYLLAVICVLLVARSALAAPPAPPTSTAPLRRFALVIGSNTGAGEHDRLRYAGHDATTMADVLQQLGGVQHADLSLLSEPNPKDLDHAFDALSSRMQTEHKRGERVELVVYYSGHADETGILIGGAHYDYGRLRERIRAVPADVRIAVVDSCASGSFTRMKGGTKVPAFLRDSSNQVEGFAFLSSSSADEDAQESDRIGASFFTYYFVAGLRGAADRNHDGKITLSEAYQFAYEQTLVRTQNTIHGPQHPSYDMHLSGTGDVVITDLRSTESAIVLPSALAGRITIVDKSGRVAVELTKDAGDPLSIALPNETYSIYVENSGGAFAATITIDHVGSVEFSQDALHKATPEETAARGVDHVALDLDTSTGEISESTTSEDKDGDDKRSPWYRTVPAGFGGGLRVERPTTDQGFDALVTLGGTSREVHGAPIVGAAETADLSLGFTLGNKVGFSYDMSLGFGPGVFVGDNLQLGATIGFGFSGITDGILPFAWKVPTEIFAIFELSPNVKPMAYFRQSYIFDSDARQNGAKNLAIWGDEAEAGAGLKFGGKLDGFFYGSVREMENVRYYGFGIGAVL